MTLQTHVPNISTTNNGARAECQAHGVSSAQIVNRSECQARGVSSARSVKHVQSRETHIGLIGNFYEYFNFNTGCPKILYRLCFVQFPQHFRHISLTSRTVWSISVGSKLETVQKSE
jgi:hypothetical protein